MADEAEAVVAEVNGSFNRLQEKHTLFGGGNRNRRFEHPGTRDRSALAHAIAAAGTVAVAVRDTRDSVVVALRAVI